MSKQMHFKKDLCVCFTANELESRFHESLDAQRCS
jgi:hypothetical protein